MEDNLKRVGFCFSVDSKDVGQRLDSLLTNFLLTASSADDLACQWLENTAISRSKTTKWIEEGLVEVDGEVVCKASFRLKQAGKISLNIEVGANGLAIESDATVPINVVYEDNYILVIDKPAGLVVHPGAGNYSRTLVNGLVHYLGEEFRLVGSLERPGLVHRLDKDTSGLLVVAKTGKAYEHLVGQFGQRTIARVYVALVVRLPSGDGTIDMSVGRHPIDRARMEVGVRGGKEALTFWSIREALKYGFLLELKLATGRTHQIRVHLKACGAAIVGDKKYSVAKRDIPAHLRKAVDNFGRQALHATRLELIHPKTERVVSFDSPIPEDMQMLIAQFRA